MNVSPNILAKNWNFKKLRHGFVDERAVITTTFNTNSKLSQNRTEKQIMPFKVIVNWLFNDIWCYLVMVCFNWKISVVQQTVVKGLLYL